MFRGILSWKSRVGGRQTLVCLLREFFFLSEETNFAIIPVKMYFVANGISACHWRFLEKISPQFFPLVLRAIYRNLNLHGYSLPPLFLYTSSDLYTRSIHVLSPIFLVKILFIRFAIIGAKHTARKQGDRLLAASRTTRYTVIARATTEGTRPLDRTKIKIHRLRSWSGGFAFTI